MSQMGEWFKFFVLQIIAKYVIPEPFKYYFTVIALTCPKM